MTPLILVVEDEPPVRRVTCAHLERAGFRCLDAETADRAQRILAAGTVPDLMVLDVRLPDVPGPAFALQVHRHHPAIPVLFVSGWIDGLADSTTLAPLRWGFLQKPFSGEALIGGVKRLLAAETRG